MSKSIYLKVDWKSGQFAEYSKDQKDGFNAYTNGKGETRYQKIYPNGIIAQLNDVELKDSNYGMQLVASFRDGDVWYNLQIPVLDQRDQVTNYAVELGRFLPNLQKGQVYRVYPYLIEKDGKDNLYDKRGISFKLNDADGEKVLPALSWKADANDSVRIPRLNWKEDTLTGKKKPTASSVEAQKEFFATIFQTETARISGSTAVDNPPAEKGNFGPPAGSGNGSETIKPEESDDVPF